MATTINIILDLFIIICSCVMFISLMFSRGQQGKQTITLMYAFGFQIGALVFDELIVSKIFVALFDELLYIFVYGKYILYLCTVLACNKFIISINIKEKVNKVLHYLYVINFLTAIIAVLLLIFNRNIIDFKYSYYVMGKDCYIFIALLASMWTVCTIMSAICHGEYNNFIYVICGVFVLASLACQYAYSNLYGVYTYGCSATLFVAYFKLRYDGTNKYIEQERKLSIAEGELLLSQIRPHFLYNALSAIGDLCTIDPIAASKSIDDFAFYLRGNIDSINNSDKVYFKDELKHISYYINLCRLRFGEKINAEFDIETEDFMIPTLSLEPFVENAIEHGIKKKKEGGTVRISTYKSNDEYHIIIEDDGVGFDVNKKEYDNDKKSHVGLENASERIKMICHGDVDVQSTIGKGTKVTIIIRE